MGSLDLVGSGSVWVNGCFPVWLDGFDAWLVFGSGVWMDCFVVGIQGLVEFSLGVWDLEFGGIFCHGCMNVAVFEWFLGFWVSGFMGFLSALFIDVMILFFFWNVGSICLVFVPFFFDRSQFPLLLYGFSKRLWVQFLDLWCGSHVMRIHFKVFWSMM